MRRLLPRLAALAFTLTALAACGGGDGDSLQVQRDTIGDTIVVQTLAGSAWGAEAHLEPEMRIGTFEGQDAYILGDVAGMDVAPDGSVYIYDGQVPALRKYSADGRFVATFGREGGGPGEYKQSDGGLRVLPDGRVLLRDPGNGRITVYSAEGEYLDTWPLRGGFFTSRPLYVDTAGNAYTQVWGRNGDESYTALRPFTPDGTPLDSMMAPEWDVDELGLTYSSESMSITYGVPFGPGEQWTFSPLGYFVGGVSTDYSFDVFRTDGPVIRIQRVIEPVPVAGAEKDAVRLRIIKQFQRYSADWKWNGPPVPDTKPPFHHIAAGRGGRIWVRLYQPGYLAETADPDDPDAVDEWAEPVAWDVFEPDGTYLGQVHAPETLSTHPEPVFGADHVWAVTTDSLDVQYLTRFRIVSDGPCTCRTRSRYGEFALESPEQFTGKADCLQIRLTSLPADIEPIGTGRQPPAEFLHKGQCGSLSFIGNDRVACNPYSDRIEIDSQRSNRGVIGIFARSPARYRFLQGKA